MKIRQSSADDVAILHLSGEIWGRSGEPEQFRSAIEQLVADGTRRVVVNLSEVRLISSIGIGMLISGYKILVGSGGTMVAAHPSDPIKPIFRALDSPFRCFDAEGAAVAFVREQGE